VNDEDDNNYNDNNTDMMKTYIFQWVPTHRQLSANDEDDNNYNDNNTDENLHIPVGPYAQTTIGE
jgi:hypothetical protein